MARFIRRARAIGSEPACKLYVYPSEPEASIEARPALEGSKDQIRSRRDDDEDDGADSGGHGGGDGGGDEGRTDGERDPARVEELLVRHSPWWKRTIDIVASLTALLILSPLMLVVAIAIKVSSKGPIFFTQLRSGLGGMPFRIYKFRTMVPDADRRKGELLSRNEQDGPAFKMTGDPRVTSIGRILRATSLDELPQFINVLRGDMSLVGPRPLPVDESRACDTWHRRRLDVVPGITCTWQIKGRGTATFAEWVRMDRDYVKRRSLIHDVKLMALTLPAVLSRRGAK
jgi:lipopolysaccharide/colanic/teichoic acid biosynthesis glycosyltransferase